MPTPVGNVPGIGKNISTLTLTPITFGVDGTLTALTPISLALSWEDVTIEESLELLEISSADATRKNHVPGKWEGSAQITAILRSNGANALDTAMAAGPYFLLTASGTNSHGWTVYLVMESYRHEYRYEKLTGVASLKTFDPNVPNPAFA